MSRKLLVGTLLLSGGVLAAVFSLTSPKPVYARSLSEFVAHPTYDQPVRIQGTVVPGSLCRRDEPCEYRFQLADQRSQLSVRYQRCLVPDTFRMTPGVDLNVTVQGELCANCHRFEASEIFTKMGGRYEMKVLDAALVPPAPVIPMPECSEP